MTDLSYTDEDLRAEAARQHGLSLEDPDFMGIGERMAWTPIESTVVDPDPATGTEPITSRTWDQLGREDFDKAQRAIDDLLTSAADLSDWAISLGADGLEPTGHTFQLGAQGTGVGDPEEPFVRLHFAFSPNATQEDRDRWVVQLARVITQNL